jgi:hypothetical protein
MSDIGKVRFKSSTGNKTTLADTNLKFEHPLQFRVGLTLPKSAEGVWNHAAPECIFSESGGVPPV